LPICVTTPLQEMMSCTSAVTHLVAVWCQCSRCSSSNWTTSVLYCLCNDQSVCYI